MLSNSFTRVLNVSEVIFSGLIKYYMISYLKNATTYNGVYFVKIIYENNEK